MLSTSHRFIYIHIPKTGGNSVQDVLLRLSDDQKSFGGFRDGIDRFEIKGEITPTKHAALAEYRERLGDLSKFSVIAGIRHPLERVVSWYFSPHRWTNEKGERIAPSWDVNNFLDVLRQVKPASAYLTIDGSLYPHVNLLRFERLASDFQALIKSLALPVEGSLPHRNRTADSSGLVAEALNDARVKKAVNEAFAQDFEAFGYSA